MSSKGKKRKREKVVLEDWREIKQSQAFYFLILLGRPVSFLGLGSELK